MEAARHLYIHVPFCDGKCAYCGFYSVPLASAGEWVDGWLDGMAREMDASLPSGASPFSVYVGGGTPTVLEPSHLQRLCRLIGERGGRGAPCEWTVEANPGTLSREKLDILTAAGVNRLSLGVQSLNDATLRRIGRRHDARAVTATVAAAREAGFVNIGMDLIAGLPEVGREEWMRTLRGCVEMAPVHLSVYALSIEAGSRFEALHRAGRLVLPDDDRLLEDLDRAEAMLAGAGYERYEISNFSRPGFACGHNLAVWRGGDYLGFGPAASSRAGFQRWTNTPDVRAYVEATARGGPPPRETETVSVMTDAQERLMFAFRLAEGVSLEAFLSRFDASVRARGERWRTTLMRLAGAGLVCADGDRWRLTARGRRFADQVALALLDDDPTP